MNIQKKAKLTLLFSLFFSLSLNLAYSLPTVLSPEYLGLIQKKIDTQSIYPAQAQAKGLQGIVDVKFTLGQGGRIKAIDVARSSGYPLLDAAAILAVKDAGPYPLPKDYTAGSDIEIVLPVIYLQPKKAPQQTKEAPAQQIKKYTAKQAKVVRSQQTKKDLPQQAKVIPPQQAKVIPPQQAKVTPPQQAKVTPPQQAKKYLPKQARILPPQQTAVIPPRETKKDIPPQVKVIPPPITPPIPPENTQAAAAIVPPQSEVDYFIGLALKNNRPIQVGKEEIELAELKVNEAKRSLAPALKILGYHTTGDVSKADFEEREERVQVDQPIFYGGRLGDTFNQARVNLEMNKKNYEALKFDVTEKAEVAYYKLAGAKLHYQLKEGLLEEAKEILDKMEKLAKEELVIPLEVKSAASWFEQVEFQLENIKQEVSMAELSFKQVLEVNALPANIETRPVELKKLNLDLDECLDAALHSRPEVALSQLLIKYNDYGQKIELSKNNAFTVDFSSYYGHYNGHFKNDPWSDADNWFAGVKVSKAWGGNTFNTSYGQDKTRTRFGQITPSHTRTASVEFDLLDNLKRLTDKKKSDIDVTRSLSDFNETTKKVAFEAQEAFYNYQKSVSQLRAAFLEVSFRRNETDVMKMRSMAGEAGLSSAMESLFNLSEAQTRYAQAATNYQVSLATLKKACGYGLKI